MATICAKNKTIGDTSCTGEAEWFNRMAATDEGAVRKKETAVLQSPFIYKLFLHFFLDFGINRIVKHIKIA